MRKVSKKVSRCRRLDPAVAQALEGRLLMSTTWTVTNANDSGAGSLRQAVLDSAAGDVIQFDPSLWQSNATPTITLTSSTINITHDLTINGPTQATLSIDGNNALTVLNINTGGNVSISNLDIEHGNGGVFSAGGIFLNGSMLHLTNVGIIANASTGAGAGMWVWNNSTVSLNNCTVDSNVVTGGSGLGGGAILGQSGTSITTTSSTYSNNKVVGTAQGGAISTYGSLSATLSTFTDNTLSASAGNNFSSGGAIFSEGLLTLDRCTFTGNAAPDGSGGALCSAFNTVTILSSSFSNNSTTTPVGTTPVTNASGSGGAIESEGTLRVINSSFTGNSGLYGGAIDSLNQIDVRNSTISGNAGKFGGGIYLQGSGSPIALVNCTISGNTGSTGGGVEYNAIGGTFANNIVSGNTTGPSDSTPNDLATDYKVGSYNLIGVVVPTVKGNTPANFVNGENHNIIGITNPLLHSAANNGGMTQTMLPLGGSPVIDAGGTSFAVDAGGQALPLDERGAPRVAGASVDIGAVEVLPPVLTAPVVTGTSGSAPQIFWNAISGATSYNIYRTTTGGVQTLIASGVTALQYTDNQAVAPDVVLYSVRAVSGATVGPESNRLSLAVFYAGSIPFVNQIGKLGVIEGTSYNMLLGQFDDSTPSPLTTAAATINWGDGVTTAATIDYDGKTYYEIRGQHAWPTAGVYTLTIHLTDVTGGSDITLTQKQTVIDAALTAQPSTVSATAGKVFSGVVGGFTDADLNAKASLYSATITWGDGHFSAGTIAFNAAAQRFDVSGTNTYSSANTYAVSIKVTDVGGSTTTIGSTANVAAGTNPVTSVLTSTGTTFTATKGISVTPLLATFTDSHAGQAASHYTATINWGDATTSAGVIALVSGKFQVTGTHTYAAAGSFTATITITDPEGGSATPTSKGTVSNPIVTPTSVLTAAGSNFTATKGISVTPLLATFTDSHTGQAASHYTANINWGDATTSAGVIALVNGKFEVAGTHTYAAAGTFTATISISDPEGGTAAPKSTATVSNPVVIPPGNSVLKGTPASTSATKGLAFSGLLLATFSDTNPSQAAGYYTTTINWGDGTSSAGVVTYNATTKLFQVAGAHTYHKAAIFNPVVGISDKAGGATSVTSKIFVADSVMHAFPTTIAAGAGKAFTGVVGSFTDGDPSDAPSDFAATINWGDGHTSAGIVSLNPTTKRFDITGTNTYATGGTFTITATPSDVGGMSIAIKSTATVTVVAGPLVKLTGATSDKEGLSESISFSATDAGNKAITKWVVDWGDGVTQNFAANATSASHTYVDGPATRIIKATATDAANLSAAATLTVGVLNVAPTATFTGGSSVQPNHTSTVSFSSVKDPSTTDTSAGFHYSFDFNNDGKFEIVNGTSLTATVPATYLATIGTKTIHGRVTDKDGGSTDYFTTINVISQPLTTFGAAIKAVEGTKFTGNIGSFADPSGNTNPAIYAATITWGDGHTSAGIVAYNATTKRFGVSGTNTYALIGNFVAAIAVKSSAGAAGTIQSTAAISDAAIAATGSSITGKEGVSVLGVVATFTDANPLAIAGNYVTSINWGDGSAASVGTVSFNTSTKRWQVSGSHTYRIGGTYTLTTSISDHGTSSAKVTSSAVIAGSTIKATGVKLTVVNSVFATTPQKVASFTTSNPLLTASDFTATVDWGDGTTSNPSSTIAIVYDSTNKVFNVMVTHPYSLLLKTYTATITITEGKGASSTTATSTILTN